MAFVGTFKLCSVHLALSSSSVMRPKPLIAVSSSPVLCWRCSITVCLSSGRVHLRWMGICNASSSRVNSALFMRHGEVGTVDMVWQRGLPMSGRAI